jgi:multicomponent Na+:H+ antiporter subunit C
MIGGVYIAVAMLMGMGFCALVLKRNLVKIAMAIAVIGSAVNLFLVSLGYRENAIAPIFTNAPGTWMVLPTPQALTLTSIVISLGMVALMLSFALTIYRHYGSLDTGKRRLKE